MYCFLIYIYIYIYSIKFRDFNFRAFFFFASINFRDFLKLKRVIVSYVCFRRKTAKIKKKKKEQV